MKAVMVSIQPKWVEKIVSGEKTIEVRKTAPKLETPFKCYIYETKAQYITYQKGALTKYGYGSGKVIGEFICDKITINHIEDLLVKEDCERVLQRTCLNRDEIAAYLHYQKGENFFNNYKKWLFYGLHISNLKIYDTPKELSEFKNLTGEPITRAFQSWGYVEIIKY